MTEEKAIILRKAELLDIPAIAKIIAENFDHAMPEHSPAIREKFKSHCSEENLRGQLNWKEIFVLCREENILGTGALVNFGKPPQDKWCVSNFFILPAEHGKGLGRELLEHLFRTAREKNISVLQVPSSLTAIGFYRKAGFIPDKVQPQEDTDDEITWMTKALS